MTNNLLLKNIIIGASTAALALSSLSAWAADSQPSSGTAPSNASGWVKQSTNAFQAIPQPSSDSDEAQTPESAPTVAAPQKPVSAPKTTSVDDQLKAQQKTWFQN
jgi:hypothetical protein